mmetsp:Transcript_24580/g.21756  ORF Transcript_24580/g.21756 Transcript_24580/m.21756 type:complete len:104 (-) Transcript_24580:279-590(-)
MLKFALALAVPAKFIDTALEANKPTSNPDTHSYDKIIQPAPKQNSKVEIFNVSFDFSKSSEYVSDSFRNGISGLTISNQASEDIEESRSGDMSTANVGHSISV